MKFLIGEGDAMTLLEVKRERNLPVSVKSDQRRRLTQLSRNILPLAW
jgi:hypothetical protein